MTKHLYLSLMPDALIASMLSPDKFGLYYAIGSHRKAHDQAIFIELNPEFRSEDFHIEEGLERCVPHEDGSPKKSVYISVYRVLERIPFAAMKKLYLVTTHGEVLALEVSDKFPTSDDPTHLYQEITPVQPLVVSSLEPKAFADFISRDKDSFVFLPAVAFVELRLGELAKDPETGSINDLPYEQISHLRECLIEIRNKRTNTKMVYRVHAVGFPYRMIKSGIFISKFSEGILYFPFPSHDELRSKYYRWWRSANN